MSVLHLDVQKGFQILVLHLDIQKDFHMSKLSRWVSSKAIQTFVLLGTVNAQLNAKVILIQTIFSIWNLKAVKFMVGEFYLKYNCLVWLNACANLEKLRMNSTTDENAEVQSLISLADRYDCKYEFPTSTDAASFDFMSNSILKFHSKIIPKLFHHFFLFSFSAKAAKKKTAKRIFSSK